MDGSLRPHKVLDSARAVKAEGVDVATELCTVFPRIPRSVYHLTEVWISRNYAVNQKNTPLLHFAYQQVGLWLLDLQHKIQIQAFSQLLMEELFLSLWELYVFIHERSLEASYEYAKIYKTISVLLSEFAVQVAFLNESPPTDFQRVSNHLLAEYRGKDLKKFVADTKICPTVDHFSQERILGAGGFGIIYKAKYEPGNMMCVLKLVPIKCFSFLRHSTIDRVIAAVTDHPLVVSYFCCFETSEMAIGAMEYVRGVNLEHVVNFHRSLPPALSQMLFGQIVAGLMHLHYSGFIYRDLKPSNVMVLIDGKIKLIDFETSRICRGHFPSNRISLFFKSTPWEFDDGEKAGTPPFQAPEVIDQQAYGRASDWWSAGIVLFKMHTGTLPYRSDNLRELRKLIVERPVTFPKLSKGVKLIKEEYVWRETNLLTAMIYALLEKEPSKRLGSEDYEEILSYPFMAQVRWDQPNYSHIIISEVFEAKTTPNKHGEYSIRGRKDLKHRILSLRSLRERTNIAYPLSNYVSKFFRRLDEGRVSASQWRGSRAPLLKNIRNVEGALVTVNGTETTKEMEKLEVAVPKGVGLAAVTPIGVGIGSTVGENGKTYYYVRKLRGSAANSGLILGDVILEINGSSIVNQSRMEVEGKLMFCTDIVFFTVMTSSPYRLCKTRRDISTVTNMYPVKTYTLPLYQEGFMKRVLPASHIRRIQVRPCGFYNEMKNIFVQLFCIWHIDSKFVEGIYFGDFLLTIDGRSASEMSEGAVNELLNQNTEERTITLIPISCLRIDRPYFDRSLRIFARNIPIAPELSASMIAKLNQEYVSREEESSETI